MQKVKVAALQFACSNVVEENLNTAERLIREAAEKGANIILPSELFERQYFCQERQYEYYEYATSPEENPAVLMCMKLAEELGVVIPVSFFEKDKTVLYNSVAVVDADGSVLGVYRKTHIPDDHNYQEKFYFTPGDTGFKIFNTRYGRIAIGICWDQWFPEVARIYALNEAQLIFYPTAIGSDPVLEDSMAHWRRTMKGHSAANLIPVIAANRIGLEKVEPCRANANQSSEILFYGSSFMTDGLGEVVAQASRDREEIIYAEYDLEETDRYRSWWGVFRDRRPEMYGDLVK